MQSNGRKPGPPQSSVRVGAETKRVRRVQSRKIPYRVGYNWNKGGRLKELRKRHLARKFLKLWMQKTFGRVHPYKAKSHYDTVVLRRAFEEWRDEWWTSRREWSLTLRAECHYRYYLYSSGFHNWQKFMTVQREKKDRVQNAQSFAVRQQVRQVWDRWEVFIEMRRMKARMLESAHQQKRITALRSAWSLWQANMQQRRDFSALEVTALKHQALTLQRRAWFRWNEMQRAACSQRENESKASLHFFSGLKRKAFHQWTSYVSCCHAKKELEALAVHACSLSLLRICWSKWRSALNQKRREEERLGTVVHLAPQSRKRRALEHWKAYVALCREEVEGNQIATQHHHHYLQHVGLRALFLNVSWNKAHRLNKNLAAQHCRQTMTSKYWKRWQERLEEAEDKSFQPQSEMALRTYSAAALSSCFHHWREKLAEKRRIQELEHRADVWFAEHTLPLCFTSWVEFTLQRRRHKQRKQKAKVFNRQRQSSLVFYTWWRESEKHKEQMLSERMAILHEERCHLQRAWDRWRERTQQKMDEEGKRKASCHLYSHTLLHKVIKEWKDNSTAIRERRSREEQAGHQGDLCCMRRAVDQWKKFVQSRRVKRNTLEQMQRYHEVQLLKRSFGAWKKHCLQMCRVYGHAEELHAEQTRGRLGSVVAMWRENAVLLAEFRIMEQRAQNHFQHVLQLKVFLAWREASIHAVSARHQQREAVIQVQLRVTQVRLQASFRRWRTQARTARRERTSTREARQHHNSKLLTRALKAWNEHHYQYQRNRVMKRQGNLLLRLKMYQKYYEQWRTKLQNRRREVQQTEKALWHWSLSLKAKALCSWRLWVTEQHRQREHLARTAQVCRDQLLREGVSCILTYAAHMNNLTSSLQQHSQEQRSRHLQRVVRRCAMRWKQQALCKPGRRRQGSRCSSPKKSVSFHLETSGSSSTSSCGVSHPDPADQRVEDGVLGKLLLTSKGRRQPRRFEELLQTPVKELQLNRQSAVTGIETRTYVTTQRRTDPHPLELSAGSHKSPTAARATRPHSSFLSAVDSPQEQHVLLPPSAFTATSTTHVGKTGNSDPLRSHQVVPIFDVCVRAEDAGQAWELTRELLSIQREMTSFQEDRKQLRAWQNLKEVMQTWLQTSRKDEEMEKISVCQELKELEQRINVLSTELSRQKPTMLRHAERIQHLQTVLHTSGVTTLLGQQTQ
ncbi:protein SFI1 homolog isoform X2 [Genypterus blacodes]|uniref:protein SFI1 homolog isoform X2 n=1 Tax=Genypterus blacodes TaxID=154954 RepID=UPI003F761FED